MPWLLSFVLALAALLVGWVPVLGPLLVGWFGGRLASGPGKALLAALPAAALLTLLALGAHWLGETAGRAWWWGWGWALLGYFTGQPGGLVARPVLHLLGGATLAGVLALYPLPLLLGALLGTLGKKRARRL